MITYREQHLAFSENSTSGDACLGGDCWDLMMGWESKNHLDVSPRVELPLFLAGSLHFFVRHICVFAFPLGRLRLENHY